MSYEVFARKYRAETRPQLQPALLRLSAMISHYFTLDYYLAARLKSRYSFTMRSFLTYLSERCKWAAKGTGRVCGWVSLVVGATLAVLIWFSPQWFHDHISDRMNAFVLGAVPLLAGASVFLVRWFVSPFPIYMQLRGNLEALTDTKKQERAKAVHGCFERSAAILKQHHRA